MLATALATYLGCKYAECKDTVDVSNKIHAILKEPNVVVECSPIAWYPISAEAIAIHKSFKIIKLACSYAAYLRRFPIDDGDFYKSAKAVQEVRAACTIGTSRRSTEAVLDYIVEQFKI